MRQREPRAGERRLGADYSDGTTDDVTYAYGRQGRLAQITGATKILRQRVGRLFAPGVLGLPVAGDDIDCSGEPLFVKALGGHGLFREVLHPVGLRMTERSEQPRLHEHRNVMGRQAEHSGHMICGHAGWEFRQASGVERSF